MVDCIEERKPHRHQEQRMPRHSTPLCVHGREPAEEPEIKGDEGEPPCAPREFLGNAVRELQARPAMKTSSAAIAIATRAVSGPSEGGFAASCRRTYLGVIPFRIRLAS